MRHLHPLHAPREAHHHPFKCPQPHDQLPSSRLTHRATARRFHPAASDRCHRACASRCSGGPRRSRGAPRMSRVHSRCRARRRHIPILSTGSHSRSTRGEFRRRHRDGGARAPAPAAARCKSLRASASCRCPGLALTALESAPLIAADSARLARSRARSCAADPGDNPHHRRRSRDAVLSDRHLVIRRSLVRSGASWSSPLRPPLLHTAARAARHGPSQRFQRDTCALDAAVGSERQRHARSISDDKIQSPPADVVIMVTRNIRSIIIVIDRMEFYAGADPASLTLECDLHRWAP